MFLILLTVGGAIVWQNDAAKTKLFRELVTVRDFINHLATGYEPWQVGIYIYILRRKSDSGDSLRRYTVNLQFSLPRLFLQLLVLL